MARAALVGRGAWGGRDLSWWALTPPRTCKGYMHYPKDLRAQELELMGRRARLVQKPNSP